jgi:hypothetical protein
MKQLALVSTVGLSAIFFLLAGCGGSGSHAEHGEEHHEEEADGHEHGEEIEYALSQVKSDSEGRGSSTTTLDDASVEKLFSGETNHVNVHEAGSGNPPILSCADLKRAA